MKIVQTLTVFVPWVVRRWILRTFFRAKIHPSARVGLSVLLCDQIDLGEGTRIGHLNVIKGLTLLRLDDFASIGHRNWISGYPIDGGRRFSNAERAPSLFLGEHAAITQSHRLDCSDKISIGRFSILAGYGSQVLTHAINVKSSQQEVGAVEFGAYTFIGTRVVVLPGCKLPAYSILAAGAVLADAYEQEFHLFGGVPAKPLRRLSDKLEYFNRTIGRVD